MRDADEHGAAIGVGIVYAVENGNARGHRAKVMVVDGRGHTIPLGARILEVAYQFPFLGIHADNRVALSAESLAQLADVAELPISIGMAGAKLLPVHAQGKVQLAEQAGDRACAYLNAKPAQLGGNALRSSCASSAGQSSGLLPYRAPTAARFPPSLRAFFSVGLRPPPARRTRSRSTSWLSSSCRPLATV